MKKDDPKIKELDEVMRKYKRTVYGIALTQLNSREDADDVFQDVFLLYFCKELSFDSEVARRSWLIKTTVNKCRQYNLNKWSKNIDKSTTPEELDAVADMPQREREIYAAVKSLPPKFREIIYLHGFLGLTVGEICDILKLKQSTVSMRLTKARKLLKQRLEAGK